MAENYAGSSTFSDITSHSPQEQVAMVDKALHELWCLGIAKVRALLKYLADFFHDATPTIAGYYSNNQSSLLNGHQGLLTCAKGKITLTS